MKHTATAIQGLERASAALREAIADAVAEDAFGEVAEIARSAEALAVITAALRKVGTVAPPTQRDARSHPDSSATVLSLAQAAGKRAAAREATPPRRPQYPQYLREGERLVKRAWSKKERQPYEHKAPREIVDVLLDAIRKHKGDQRPFEAADIMPLFSKNGDEYPSYQSYLALGWLRTAGAIAKGREGYLLKRGWEGSRVALLWDALPSVA